MWRQGLNFDLNLMAKNLRKVRRFILKANCIRANYDYTGADSVCKPALKINPKATCLESCPFLDCIYTIATKKDKVMINR